MLCSAMFRSQYILEMAKNKWTVSNPWIYDYGDNYSVFPVWYINPLLINYFGRDMVTAPVPIRWSERMPPKMQAAI